MTQFEPSVRLTDHGTLPTPRYERMAILLADDFPATEVWKACGGSTTESGSRKYGKRIFNNPVFKGRVAALVAEREKLFSQDPAWGDVAWQANQAYRLAFLQNDIKTMLDAVKLRAKIAEFLCGQTAASEVADLPDPTRKGPGAPVSELGLTRRDPAQIRAILMAKNREAVKVGDEEE